MTTTVDVDDLRAAEPFVYREARLCDEHRFAEWEALWTDDAIFWVPANGDHSDPTRQVSVLFDCWFGSVLSAAGLTSAGCNSSVGTSSSMGFSTIS